MNDLDLNINTHKHSVFEEESELSIIICKYCNDKIFINDTITLANCPSCKKKIYCNNKLESSNNQSSNDNQSSNNHSSNDNQSSNNEKNSFSNLDNNNKYTDLYENCTNCNFNLLKTLKQCPECNFIRCPHDNCQKFISRTAHIKTKFNYCKKYGYPPWII